MIIKNIDNKTFGLRFSKFNYIFPSKTPAISRFSEQESAELKPIIQRSIKNFSDDSYIPLEKTGEECNKFLEEHPFFAFWAHFFD